MSTIPPTIIAFPRAPAPPPRAATVPGHRSPCAAARRTQYTPADLAAALHLGHFSTRTIIAKLRILAETQGLPLPRTPRIVAGRAVTGPESIHLHSRWDAGEVDAWLAGGDPPPAGAALAPPQPLLDEIGRRAAAIGSGR